MLVQDELAPECASFDLEDGRKDRSRRELIALGIPQPRHFTVFHLLCSCWMPSWRVEWVNRVGRVSGMGMGMCVCDSVGGRVV